MNRTTFGLWGLELSPEDFACALAALGVGQACFRAVKPLATEYDASELKEALHAAAGEATGKPAELKAVPWRLLKSPDRLAGRYLPPGSAGRMAAAWRTALDGLGLGFNFRLEVRPSPEIAPVLPWVMEQLSNNDVRAASVYALEEAGSPEVHWHWPLQVGFLDEPLAQGMRHSPEPERYHLPLARFRTLPAEAERCDVLLLSGSLRQSLVQVLNQTVPLRASCVVVLGGMDEPWSQSREMKSLLRQATGAAGVCILNVPESDRTRWLTQLAEMLSHNLSLDVALYNSMWPRTVLYLFAGPRLLSSTLLTNVALALSGRLAELPKNTQLTLPSLVFERIGLAGPLDLGSDREATSGYSSTDLSKWIASNVDKFDFTGESHAATGVSGLAGGLEKAVQGGAVPAVPPRWIQAKVFEAPDYRKALRRALRSDRDHAVDVRIGPQDKKWLSTPRGAVFPEWELPEQLGGHELTVVFSEPIHTPEPQVKTIFLRNVGGSTTCRFYFHTLTGATAIDARILVLYENRVLQTARLRAGVLPEPLEAPSTQHIHLGIEAVLRANLAGLENRRHFDAALLVNESADGQHCLTEVSGERALIHSVGGLEAASGEIRALLGKITDHPLDFTIDQWKTATEDLLRALALKGNLLYGALVKGQIGSRPLAYSRRLQLISATPEAFLPLEFVYDRPAPALDAKLCPHFLQAPESDTCSSCPGSGEKLDVKKYPKGYPHICPLGFWGLSRVIERHALRPDESGDDLGTQDFSLRSEPYDQRTSLAPLSAAIYAASSKVDEGGKAGQIQSVLQALQNVTQNHAVQVDKWADWVSEVETSPSFLVLLPHSLKVDNEHNALEISKGEDLIVNYLTDAYVHPKDKPGPLVLLLGCETLNPEIPFQSFVAQFQLGGAAIVLGTATTVLGRHAAPVAVMVTEILKDLASKGTFTFGEVMQLLRRRALARNIPMALTLFAYGDSDWRLTL